MKIVVANEVVMVVDKYVSYMRNDVKYNYHDLIRNKDEMLQYVRNFINKAVVANDNKVPKQYYCSWKDGKSPMSWIFKFIILPQQDLTVIYSLDYKHSIEENKEIKTILSLMERMGIKKRGK